MRARTSAWYVRLTGSSPLLLSCKAKWYETMFSLPLPRLNRPSKGHLTRNHRPRTPRQIKGRNLPYVAYPLEDTAWVSDALSASHAVAPGGSTSRRAGCTPLGPQVTKSRAGRAVLPLHAKDPEVPVFKGPVQNPPLDTTHQRTPIRRQYPIDELQISSPSFSSSRSTTTCVCV